MDKFQEAITFAEAGETQSAVELTAFEPPEPKIRRLVVSGRGTNFSKELVDYAIEMAQRFRYEIIALNALPLQSQQFDHFSSYHPNLFEDFKNFSCENIRFFKQEAAQKSIPLNHVVKFTHMDQAIEEIKNEFGQIEFIISDSEEERPVQRPEEAARPRPEIYVYSLA